MIRFGLIVEGHGEVEAFPALVRRILFELQPGAPFRLERPIRITRSRLLREGELERAVRLAVYSNNSAGPVIVHLDSDDDCPAQLGPDLLNRARKAAGPVPVTVILAHREFEAWLLAGASSLGGLRGLQADLADAADPEAVRDAKGWLSRHMEGSRVYSPSVDQAALASLVDILAAQRAPSFRRCCREVRRVYSESVTLLG